MQTHIDDMKSLNTVQDIEFLLCYIHEHPQPWGDAVLPVSRAMVLRATPFFLKALIQEHPDLAPACEPVGYNFTTGKLFLSIFQIKTKGGFV
jgi:hypothetical protein